MNAKVRPGRAAIALIAAAALGYAVLHRSVAVQVPAAQSTANYFAFVRSMQGTVPDGAPKQDAADRLVIDEELGHLFDYYLSGLGETSLASVQIEIERDLKRRLRPVAAMEARRLLSHYIDYKRALAYLEKSLPRSGNTAQDARARQDGMRRLREQYFQPNEIAGLFAATDAYADDTLARLDITADRHLSTTERDARLAELDRKLPATLRTEREAPTRILRLEEAVQQKRAQGADDNEIYRLRASALDPQAAARLADLDRDEAAWQRRISTYQHQRKQLLANAASEDAQQELRNTNFSAEEQRRLGAYE